MITTTRRAVQTQTRILECSICEAYTNHALNWSKTEFVCGTCGNTIEYHVNAARPMCAIDLRASSDARQRFEDWIAEQ